MPEAAAPAAGPDTRLERLAQEQPASEQPSGPDARLANLAPEASQTPAPEAATEPPSAPARQDQFLPASADLAALIPATVKLPIPDAPAPGWAQVKGHETVTQAAPEVREEILYKDPETRISRDVLDQFRARFAAAAAAAPEQPAPRAAGPKESAVRLLEMAALEGLRHLGRVLGAAFRTAWNTLAGLFRNRRKIALPEIFATDIAGLFRRRDARSHSITQALVFSVLIAVAVTTFSTRVLGLRMFPSAQKMADASMYFDLLRGNLTTYNFTIASKQVDKILALFTETQAPLHHYINAGDMLFNFPHGQMYKNSYYALQFYEKAMTLSPPDEQRRWLLMQVGNCYYRLGIYTRAIGDYESLLSRYNIPAQKAEVYFRLARCHEKLGHHDQARQYYSRIIEEFPQDAYAEKAFFAIAGSFKTESRSGDTRS